MGDLSANLTWREVLRGGGYELDDLPPELREAVENTARTMFQPLRDAFGGPLMVVSGGGLRSREVNKACGGSLPKKDDNGVEIPGTGSQHLVGLALDLKAKTREGTLALYDLAAALQGDQIPLGGCALYLDRDDRPRFVHVDARLRRARWNAGSRAKAIV